MDGSYCCVYLSVRAETKFGQTLCVAGSSIAMGKFNPAEAVELTTSPETYPIWKTSRPLILPRAQGARHTYLYLLNEAGKFKEWEFEGGLRFLVCTGARLDVQDVYGDVGAINLRSGPSPVAPVSKNSPKVLDNKSEGVEEEKEGTANKSRPLLQHSGSQAEALSAHASPDLRGLPGPSPPSCFDGVFKLLRTLSGGDLKDTKRTAEAQAAKEKRELAGREDGLSPMFAKHQDASLFLVCYHLPVRVFRQPFGGGWGAEWKESLLAKGDDSISEHMRTRWVGTVGLPADVTARDREQIVRVLEGMNCTPVFLPEALDRTHYYGFCKQLLWPAFHNVDLLELTNNPLDSAVTGEGAGEAAPAAGASGWDQQRYQEWYAAYKEVNQMIADVVNPMIKPGDVVWTHDYHLMLVPKLIHDHDVETYGMRRSNQVFFLHIPFPTSQIFRTMFCGVELLQGCLSADVVGFHSFDHARHFLNASKRLMGLNYHSRKGGLIGVEHQGRLVMVVMSHVGVEPLALQAALQEPACLQERARLQERFGARAAVVALDVGQRLSGVVLKLLAYERLLRDYAVWRDRVVLVQWVLLPDNRPADEAATCARAASVAARIRQQFGEACLEYREFRGHDALPRHRRLALWGAGHVFVTSAVREGLNTWPLEYLFARRAPSKPGLVLASEFGAAASLLNGALRVNPFNTAGFAAMLDQALGMGAREKEARRARDQDFLSARPSAMWTRQILADMWSLAGSVVRPGRAGSFAMAGALGLGGGPRRGTTGSDLEEEEDDVVTRGHSPLDLAALRAGFRAARRRVLLLDYGGTLIHTEASGKYLKKNLTGMWDRALSPGLAAALARLTEDPQNLVFVISGLSKDIMERTFKRFPGIGLAASNGMACSWPTGQAAAPGTPNSPSRRKGSSAGVPQPWEGGERESTVEESGADGRVWTRFDYGVDWAGVREVALPILRRATARTNGSRVKTLDAGLSWDYYATDPEWGQKMARHLVAELSFALAAYDVQVTTIRSSVDVLPKRMNKGNVVRRILNEEAQAAGMPGCIFCVGDDVSDEHMFKSIYAFLSDHGAEPGQPTPVQSVFTATVGCKPSYADHYLHDVGEVEAAICGLVADNPPPRTNTPPPPLN